MSSNLSPSSKQRKTAEFDAIACSSTDVAEVCHSLSRNGSDTEIPLSSMPKHALNESGSEISAHHRPESRSEMRPPNSSPSTSYRIPSHVFARSKSNAPTEWSVTSNESLFSIYTGNTSFAKDQYSDVFSGPLLDFSSDQTSTWPSGMDGKSNLPEQQSITASKAAEIGSRMETKPENVDELTKEISLAKGVIQYHGSSHHSDVSGSSCKSFAFPVLTRIDTNDSTVRRTNVSPRSQSQTPRDIQFSKSIPEKSPLDEVEKKPEQASTPMTTSVVCCSWLSCFTGSQRSRNK